MYMRNGYYMMFISKLTNNGLPTLGKVGKSMCSRLYKKSKYTTDLKLNLKFQRETMANLKNTNGFTLKISFKLSKK